MWFWKLHLYDCLLLSCSSFSRLNNSTTNNKTLLLLYTLLISPLFGLNLYLVPFVDKQRYIYNGPCFYSCWFCRVCSCITFYTWFCSGNFQNNTSRHFHRKRHVIFSVNNNRYNLSFFHKLGIIQGRFP